MVVMPLADWISAGRALRWLMLVESRLRWGRGEEMRKMKKMGRRVSFDTLLDFRFIFIVILKLFKAKTRPSTIKYKNKLK